MMRRREFRLTLVLKLIIVAFLCFSQGKKYNGYTVVETDVLRSVKVIEELVHFVQSSGSEAFDFWVNPGIGRMAKIMAHPMFYPSLEDFLNDKSIAFKVIINDVERAFQKEARILKKRRFQKPMDESIDWQAYYSTKEIYHYLDKMERDYQFASVVKYGNSMENRCLKLLRINKAGFNGTNIFIEAGIHAREWISPSMATYLIHSLLENTENMDYLNKFNFHIIPVANPDGYEFSRKFDRLWRKTRRNNPGSHCKGVDGNRNWDFHWREKGANNSPCSQTYPGPFPFSEPETDAIRNYLTQLKPSPTLSLSLHSAAKLLLIPYGYSNLAYPDNYVEQLNLGREAILALNNVHNSNFKVLHSANLYPASGASDDWYVGVLGSRFAYTLELRQGGLYGFDLPPNQIIPSGEEFWAAFKVFLNRIGSIES